MNEPTPSDVQRQRDAEVIRAHILTFVKDRLGRQIAASSQVTVFEALLRLEAGDAS